MLPVPLVKVVFSTFLLYQIAAVFPCVIDWFKTLSHSVVQAGVEWHDHGSLYPQTPGLKWSSCLNLLSSRDYRQNTPRPANFLIFSRDRVLPLLARLVSNSWSQVIHRLSLPKCWDSRREPPCPKSVLYSLTLWIFLLFVISKFIPLWLAKILNMILILNLLRLVLWFNILYPENVPCAL